MYKPYRQICFSRYMLRWFSTYNYQESLWHRDANDRKVMLLYGSASIQMEDELPERLRLFKWYSIPKETYHRVLFRKWFVVLIKNS